MDLARPWLAYCGDAPHQLDYPAVTMAEALIRSVARCPDAVAQEIETMGDAADVCKMNNQRILQEVK